MAAMSLAVPVAPQARQERAATARAALVQTLRDRLVGGPIGQPLLGWLGPLLAALVGGILRFWDLGYPCLLYTSRCV